MAPNLFDYSISMNYWGPNKFSGKKVYKTVKPDILNLAFRRYRYA